MHYHAQQITYLCGELYNRTVTIENFAVYCFERRNSDELVVNPRLRSNSSRTPITEVHH